MRSADSFATVFEQHRRVLRRQAGRLLSRTGIDPDDVLQDVYLRAHAALEAGVVPIEPRAWLLRLVRNACLDELRRMKARPVGDAVLDAMPSVGSGLTDELAARAEARALLADMQRLPDRQKSVLVLNALDGLSHEEVADRLDTTVHTTRSLLARARANLKQTAAARETSCSSVEIALEEAASAGVRASELARRHLWSCSGCRAFQRDLRVGPSRLRRLASWSPWALVAQLLGGGGKAAVGVCCALVVGGSAVTVPVVERAVHRPARPNEVVANVGTAPPSDKPKRRRAAPRTPAPTVTAPAPETVRVVDRRTSAVVGFPVTSREPRAARRPRRSRPAARSRAEERQFRLALRYFVHTKPTDEERRELLAIIRRYRASPKHSTARVRALRRLQAKAYSRRPAVPVIVPAPAPRAAATPTATPTATPRPVEPTPTPRPAEPAATPSPAATATPVATETPTAVPVEATATPTP